MTEINQVNALLTWNWSMHSA